MNICISICGIDFDFEKSYNKPKPFINILGKPMIYWVIDKLKLKIDDKIFVVYPSSLKNDIDFLNFQSRYETIQYIEIFEQSNGPVETFKYMFNKIENINLNKKCIVIDCDNIFYYDILSAFRNKTINLLYYFTDEDIKPLYSYLSINDNDQIVQIKEKEKISNHANCGCYCFESTKILKEYTFNSNSIYLSGIVQEMIDKEKTFMSQLISKHDYACVGTPNLLKIFCSEHFTKTKRFSFTFEKTLVVNNIPIENNIKYVNFLKSLDHIIIINTHLSNKGKEGKLIYKLLEKHNIPYDEVYFNQIEADFHIQSFKDIEKETGIYQTEISERFFNKVESKTFDVIVKKSLDKSLKGEIYWYQNIPSEIKHIFPTFFFSNENNTYTIEKINGISVSYLFTQNSLDSDTLFSIINSLEKIHNSKTTEQSVDIYLNYCEKLKQRYENYDYSQFPRSNEIYNSLIDYFKNYKTSDNGKKVVIHGDPVLTNIIIDKKSNLKFIDMRGLLGDTLTLYGDKWYDYGKLYQSLIGYDHVLHGVNYNGSYIKRNFESYIKDNHNINILENIKMITKSLIFSLIPLHKEKQMEFYKLISTI